MEELTDDFIFSRLSESYPIESNPDFTLEYLIGKTIKEHRTITYRKFREIRDGDSDDPHINYPCSPENLEVLIFSDKTFLASESRGTGGDGNIGFYYFDGKRILYSDELFHGFNYAQDSSA